MPQPDHLALTGLEKRAIGSLAAVVGLRMVGLFLIVPVLALYAHELPGATPLTIGIALGVYGLTQAAMQIPLGYASDKWGRKPIISLGVIIFAIGCIIAATSESIAGVTLGRAVQGAGAVAAAVFAFVGDFTRDSQRTKAMAVMGASIGAAFTASLVLAPILDRWIELRGLFWVAFALAVTGLLLLWLVVPAEAKATRRAPRRASASEVRRVLCDLNLARLYSGSFVLHAAMTALFVAFPTTALEVMPIERDDIWKVYVPVLLLSFILMLPFIRLGSNRNLSASLLFAAACVLAAGEVLMSFGLAGSAPLLIGFLLFFVGFNTLEALLPSTAIRAAPDELRGTAMGAFNTCTFAGIFAGGVFGGFLFGSFGAAAVFAASAVAVGLWGLFALSLRLDGPSRRPRA